MFWDSQRSPRPERRSRAQAMYPARARHRLAAWMALKEPISPISQITKVVASGKAAL